MRGFLKKPAILITFAGSLLTAMPEAAVEKITPPAEANTSFIGTYLNYVLLPKNQRDTFNPMDIRTFPERYNLLSGGISFRDITVSDNVYQITIYQKQTPIAQIIAARSTGVRDLESNIINTEFTGNLITGTNNAKTSDETLYENILNECSNNIKIQQQDLNEQKFTYLDCSSRNTWLFLTRIPQGFDLKQVYANEKSQKNTSNGESKKTTISDTTQEHLIVIHYLNPEKINYQAPFKNITDIGLPINSINSFLDHEFLKLTQSERIENILFALNSDYEFLHARYEDIMRDDMLNPEYTLSEQKDLPNSKINHAKNKHSFSIINRAENFFNNNLTIFADDSKSKVASSVIVTPLLLNTADLESLADDIANDITCVASEKKEVPLGNTDALEIDCSVPYSTTKLTKSYYLLSADRYFDEENSSDSPSLKRIQLLFVTGGNENNEAEDIIDSIDLSANYRWDLDFKDLTGQDLDLIFTIPNTKKWYETFIKTESDERPTTNWYRFAAEGQNTFNSMKHSKPEEILEKLKGIAQNISANKNASEDVAGAPNAENTNNEDENDAKETKKE